MQFHRCFPIALGLSWACFGQMPAAADEAAEGKQADAYWQASNRAAALPLYEHLTKLAPKNMEYAERFSFCLVGKAAREKDPQKKRAIQEQALAEAKRAESLGDRSNLLTIIIERLQAGPVSQDFPTSSANAAEEMKMGESAFGSGDLEGAIQHYKAAAAADPQQYEARLFTGDMYFRKKDPVQAGEWFAQAIAVAPNRETAYRYWGDALMNSGEIEQAREKFIAAVVAEPYQRTAWMGLMQWAKRANVTLHKPNVPRPDPLESATGPWLVYRTTREQWHNKLFVANFPMETQYRHSLAEEAAALNAVVDALKDKAPDQLDPGLQDLMRIGAAHGIEAFILINGADKDIAGDYGAYRDRHWEELQKYVADFVLK